MSTRRVLSADSYAMQDSGCNTSDPYKIKLETKVSGKSNNVDKLQSPIVETADSKQWLDLDLVAPKIVKEIRRKYDPNFRAGKTESLSKNAARIVAWARQTKSGVEVRSRRKKFDHRHIDTLSATESWDNPLTQPVECLELPAYQQEPIELADTSVCRELDSTPCSSRTSFIELPDEPLPLYESPRRHVEQAVNPKVERLIDDGAVAHPHCDSAGVSPMSAPPMLHRSLSQGSIVTTPIEGLSLRSDNASTLTVTALIDSEHEEPKSPVVDDSTTARPTEDQVEISTDDFRNVVQRLRREGDSSEILQALVDILSSNARQGDQDSKSRGHDSNAHDLRDGLRPSLTAGPAPRKGFAGNTLGEASRKRIVRKKTRVISMPKKVVKRTVSEAYTSSRANDAAELPATTYGNVPLVKRTKTAPAPSAADDASEAIWATVLNTQAQLLGHEHPLVYQAKSDLAKSRATGHQIANLDAIRQSLDLAIDTLGSVHPLVTDFSHTVKLLDKTTSIAHRSQVQQLRKQLPRLRTSGSQLKSKQPYISTDQDALELQGPDQRLQGADVEPPVPNSRQQVESCSEYPEEEGATDAFGHHETSPANHDTDFMRFPTSPLRRPRNKLISFGTLAFLGLADSLGQGMTWLRANYGPEPPVPDGKVRVRWTCSCGEELYDDFVERRAGAARELEAHLNGVRTYTRNGNSPASSTSSPKSVHSSLGSSAKTASSKTSWSSLPPPPASYHPHEPGKSPQLTTRAILEAPNSPFYDSPWLLTCANEDLFTPKIAHLDMDRTKIRSDKDLALSLREHYSQINKKWWRPLRLRGLTTIEFVQFEVHQNRFADIRKCPDMPPLGGGDYDFEAGDLLPPVGSTYLLHLFRHPEDYDGELITYFRAPKRNGRLHLGIGWGINLVEGFLAYRVWLLVTAFFALGSLIFGIVWACREHDIQGAFGVAAWIVALAALAVGWFQACLC